MNITKLLLSLCITIGLVIFSYFKLDQAITRWLAEYPSAYHTFFINITYIPNALVYLSAIALVLLFVFSSLDLSRTFQLAILSIVISCYTTLVLSNFFKIIFGRIGPKFWIKHHFDLHAYGFSFFHGMNKSLQAFPSGHTGVIFAMMTVFWLLYPKSRMVCFLICFVVVIALLETFSHFLSDCIAGAYLGTLMSYLCVHFLKNKKTLFMNGSTS